MRAQFLSAALLALAARVAAVQVTSPAKDEVVDLSKGVTVKWTTVSTDPSRAHLVLVNMAAGHTPFSKDLGEVDLSKGSVVVTEKGVPDDEGYQFNFESVESGNTGILAQSEQFEVKGSGESDGDSTSSSSSSSATGSSTTGTGLTASVTTTATVTSTGASDSATTSAPTTLATVSSSAGGQGASTTGSAASSTSTGGAAVGQAVQGGSVLALIAGLAAFIA